MPGFGIEAAPIVLAGLGAALGLGDLFTAALPYPMVKRAGFPILVTAPGYGAYRFGGVLGTLAGTAAAATPVIIGVVLAATDSDAIRIGVMLAVRGRVRFRARAGRRAASRGGGRGQDAGAVPGRSAQRNDLSRRHSRRWRPGVRYA